MNSWKVDCSKFHDKSFLMQFFTSFQMIFFLSSLAATVWEIEIFSKKISKIKKKQFSDRISSKFAWMLVQPPSTYIKNLVMRGVVGTLRTELS